ncbi:hypothetical protein PIB30_029901 [Stylosanthes scabra]|uniref:Replication protein A 70 kDa DNA-binding subunit B/D first OB fold domain-containing protein n=1 Tax=Stylosanthes scabra TaxID=79078 RepID=A0ABU6RC37_9FABA|nr:hypothetical protein [Stylosanthes scabra]
MASGQVACDLGPDGYRVADIKPANIYCKLVVAVVRLYELPNQWIGKDATSIEMVLQDREGDRIHCSITRGRVGNFKTVIRENGIYAMQNFVIQRNAKPPKTTPHQYKLSFYGKTKVRSLARTAFEFSRFRFMSFPEIEAISGQIDSYHIGESQTS